MDERLHSHNAKYALGLLMVFGLSGLAIAEPVRNNTVPGLLERVTEDPKVMQVDLATALEGSPDVVIVMLDDVGFGAASTFGGPVKTPTLDRIADRGLRYNRFHTTAICSPTRAALLTGRNAHTVGWGRTAEVPADYPGYNHQIPRSAATLAEVLRQNGYGTALWGKWHLTPLWETSPIGPFDRWPTYMGFEKFYGFLGGEAHHFAPTLYEGTTMIRRPDKPDYHLTEDLTDQAISWMQLQNSLAPDKPVFMYVSTGANHAPLHVPKDWMEQYRGQFDLGWDQLREETFVRQKALGVIPEDAVLTPRPDALPGWDEMTPERRIIAARLMEAYAGMLAHADAEIGRLVDSLESMGRLDNTIFIYIVGDNGGSGEGSPTGTLNEHGMLQGVTETDEEGLERLEEIGTGRTFAQYPAGFAWAVNSPFQWTKQIAAHFGGSRNPMVISWPKGISDQGSLRSQFSHVNSIMPTVLEAVGIEPPEMINSVVQQPIDGVSLVYTFDDADAKERHKTQYFEIMGNRGVYHDGWMASVNRGRAPWDVARPFNQSLLDDTWELYHIDNDFTQSRDLAASKPDKLRQMKELFWHEAERNQVLPVQGTIKPMASLYPAERTTFTFHPGAVGIPGALAPAVINRAHSIEARVRISREGAEGVLVAQGGEVAGYSMYIDPKGHLNYAYNLFGVTRTEVVSTQPLKAGERILRVEVEPEKPGFGQPAKVHLFVDKKQVASGRLARTVPLYYSIDETFDVGTDRGSPVGPYPVDYDFTGVLESVTIQLF